MRTTLLLLLFGGLMADGMFGWGITVAPGVSLKNALLYVIVLVIAIELATSSRRFVVDLPAVHLAFLAFIALALLSWTTNTFLDIYAPYSPTSGLIALKGSLLDHYLFFLVFMFGLRTAEEALWLQRWILVMILLGNIATVMDAYGVYDFASIEIRSGGRVKGPIGEANQYGLFLAMFLPILMAKAVVERGAMRVLYALGSIATLWALLLTISRGAFVALIVGSLFSAFVFRRHFTAAQVGRAIAVAVVGLVGLALLLGQEYYELIRERTVEAGARAGAYELTSGRTWIWSNALSWMLGHPGSFVIGHGWDTFIATFKIASHSVYVGLLFELGVPGLLLYLTVLALVIRSAIRAVNLSPADNAIKPELIAFVFGFSSLAVGIASVDLGDPWYFIWAYTGMMMRLASGDMGGPKPAAPPHALAGVPR